MPLVYITGPAGSGKTAILNELRRRGVTIYDEDEPSIGSAHNKQSGQAVGVPPASQRSPEWFNQHEWKVKAGVLEDLKSQSLSGLVLLCGNSLEPEQIQHYFDKVVYLHVDEETLRKRIAERKENDYGKNDHELDGILERYRQMDQTYSPSNSIVIDATQSIEKVASDILSAI